MSFGRSAATTTIATTCRLATVECGYHGNHRAQLASESTTTTTIITTTVFFYENHNAWQSLTVRPHFGFWGRKRTNLKHFKETSGFCGVSAYSDVATSSNVHVELSHFIFPKVPQTLWDAPQLCDQKSKSPCRVSNTEAKVKNFCIFFKRDVRKNWLWLRHIADVWTRRIWLFTADLQHQDGEAFRD